VWFGVAFLIMGALLSLWPDVRLREVGAWTFVRATAGATTAVALTIVLATSAARASELSDGSVRHLTTTVAARSHPASDPKPRVTPWLIAVGVGLAMGALRVAARRRASLHG
jgi:uncharacterized membrane protein